MSDIGQVRIDAIRLRLRVLAWSKREKQWRKARGDEFASVNTDRHVGGDGGSAPGRWSPQFRYFGPRREWWWRA